MPNITGGEILIILLVALIVLGPQRLPDAARSVARATREFRKVQTTVQTEIRSTIDEVTRPVTETASAMQQSIAETTKEISPGGPGTHVDPGRRPYRPGTDDVSARRDGIDPTATPDPDRRDGLDGDTTIADPARPAPAPAAGTAVFTPRRPARPDPPAAPAEPADGRTAEPTPPPPRQPPGGGPSTDDWGEAGLYDDAR